MTSDTPVHSAGLVIYVNGVAVPGVEEARFVDTPEGSRAVLTIPAAHCRFEFDSTRPGGPPKDGTT
jgi:hypothetical protein